MSVFLFSLLSYRRQQSEKYESFISTSPSLKNDASNKNFCYCFVIETHTMRQLFRMRYIIAGLTIEMLVSLHFSGAAISFDSMCVILLLNYGKVCWLEGKIYSLGIFIWACRTIPNLVEISHNNSIFSVHLSYSFAPQTW